MKELYVEPIKEELPGSSLQEETIPTSSSKNSKEGRDP